MIWGRKKFIFVWNIKCIQIFYGTLMIHKDTKLNHISDFQDCIVFTIEIKQINNESRFKIFRWNFKIKYALINVTPLKGL